MSKVFISGPIRKMPEYNRPAFYAADVILSTHGHTVLSPTRLIPNIDPESITPDEYLKICFAMIDCCDTVYFLKGWERSDGARQEFQYATEHKKELQFEKEGNK